MDFITADIVAPIIALFFSFFILRKFKIENLIKEVSPNNKNKFLNIYLNLTIKFICPIVVSSIVILKIISIIFGKNISDL